MRSHAKASTAGSPQRRTKGLGRIFRGVFATRGASFGAKGSGAPKSRLLALPVALVVAAFSLVLGVGSAVAVAPTIVSSTVSAVTSSTALLEAEINPEGEATTYHFEYGLADCSSNPCTSTPVPDANVGSGTAAVQVEREIKGLSPDTTYHFRVVANNGSGPSAGADRTFTTYAASASDTNCPNQAFRVGPGANLPDCRAYEMVSPVDKGGRGIVASTTRPGGQTRAAYDQAAVDGNAITFTSATSFGDQPSNRNANQYLSRRGPSGWTTQGISAPLGTSLLTGAPAVTAWGFDTQFQSFSDDLSTAWIRDANASPLTPDAFEGFANLYRRDNTKGTYHDPVITSEPLLWEEAEPEKGVILGSPASDGTGLTFKGRSEDGSHIVFETASKLTPDAASNPPPLFRQIYDYSDGELRVVSVFPNGEANPLASLVGGPISTLVESSGEARGVSDRAISEDGSRIFWTTPMESSTSASAVGDSGKVYVRIDGTTTVAVSESVTNEPSSFLTANPDGSKAMFSFDPDALGSAEEDLYEFDVDTETPHLIAQDVTAMPGASEDLSTFYFVSREALDAGATAGEENLYVDHEGTVEFVATLAVTDVFRGDAGPTVGGRRHPLDGNVDPNQLGVRVTPDGSHLAFMSSRSLTGYDNTDAVDGKADVEVFLYDADADGLTCVSCSPSGARPHGAGTRVPAYNLGKPEVAGSEWRTAAWIPPWEHERHAARVLSVDGNRLFFNAVDALLPQDTNGVQDVYQWEAQGTGSCQKAGGCVNLISTGKSSTYSEFIDASADGSDVFIRTESSIDPRDPGLMDIYNARVGGGFPPPPPPPTPCLGDGCQGAPPPPNDPTPASAAFRGAGDPQPRKAQRRCRARARQAGRNAKGKAKRKAAKRCRRAKRGANR